MRLYLMFVMAPVVWLALTSSTTRGQTADLGFLNGNHSVLDAHNCYPYEGRWSDRIDRALKTGFPVAIEQDVAFYRDPASGKGRVVVSHTAKTTGSEPEERQYFFERVRPVIEEQLATGDHTKWPVIILHFDFKDQRQELLHAVWDLLGEYGSWITTAPKLDDPYVLAPFDRKPILVLTEDSDAQEQVFFHSVASGSRLRVFGSAHTRLPDIQDEKQLTHLAATLTPAELLPDRPTNYRRWWNNSWFAVEEGGQRRANAWTSADDARLRALVDHAHSLGYWIRFYTLDGFETAAGHENGWLAGYNFGSLPDVKVRWNAAINAGVNLIATDQYEELAEVIRAKRSSKVSER